MKVEYIHDTEVHNTRAAEILVPKLIAKYNVNSVVDVGCGIGTWLSVFAKFKLDYLGVDGDYTDRDLLCIDESNFKCFDLNNLLVLDRRYDMAVCLEVAEHLKPESATIICESLTNMSDLVIFSAAIPGQGGQNHLNEQYPQYWVKIFESMGYFLVEDIKLEIWENSEIEWWYRQNLMILKKNPNPEEKKKLFFAIHPDLYQIKVEECERSASDYQKVIRGKISIIRGTKILAKALLNSLKF